MNSIKLFERISTYIGVFFGTIISYLAHDYLKQKVQDKSILILLLFLIFLFFIEIVRAFFQGVINKSSHVRWLICYGDYIEGIWKDMTTDNGEHTYGVYIIRYYKGKYNVIGREFDSDGNMICDWNSISSDYDGNCLIYLYKSRWAAPDQIEESYGLVSLSYMRNGPTKNPKTASGYSIDIAKGLRKIVTVAQKISGHSLKKFDKIKDIQELVNNWIEECKKSA